MFLSCTCVIISHKRVKVFILAQGTKWVVIPQCQSSWYVIYCLCITCLFFSYISCQYCNIFFVLNIWVFLNAYLDGLKRRWDLSHPLIESSHGTDFTNIFLWWSLYCSLNYTFANSDCVYQMVIAKIQHKDTFCDNQIDRY